MGGRDSLVVPLLALALASALALTACGSGLTRDLTPRGGGAGGGSSQGDSSAAATWTSDDAGSAEAAPCSPSRHFGMPALVPGLSIGTYSARLSPDERTVYFGQDRGGQVDILVATRPTRSDPFGESAFVSALDGAAEDNHPSVTADGLTLYMDSQRTARYELYVSTRPRTSDAFAAPVLLSALTSTGEGSPYVTADGGALYFHSWRTGDPDLFRAARGSSPAIFDTPERLAVISTGAIEYAPVVSPDELTIYFQSLSNPVDENGIWTATRGSLSASFGSPVYLSELNGSYGPPSPSWISPDGCRIYFAAPNDTTGTWIYIAERTP